MEKRHRYLGGHLVSQTCFILHEILGNIIVVVMNISMESDFSLNDWIPRFVIGWFSPGVYLIFFLEKINYKFCY